MLVIPFDHSNVILHIDVTQSGRWSGKIADLSSAAAPPSERPTVRLRSPFSVLCSLIIFFLTT